MLCSSSLPIPSSPAVKIIALIVFNYSHVEQGAYQPQDDTKYAITAYPVKKCKDVMEIWASVSCFTLP